ncbi:MAG: RidA family protein [Burkholderiaceae bacterium]
MKGDKRALPASSQTVKSWSGSRAVKLGSTIHVAGTMGVRADGTLVSEVNLERQIDAVYANLKEALAEFGASLADVVSETVFVTDLAHPYVMDKVGRAYAGQAVPPARTVCQVEKLLLPNAMIAVSCIAELPA